MNEEKKIAQAILDAQRYHKESFDPSGFGEYKLEWDECFEVACENNGLSSNIGSLLSLTISRRYDVRRWAKDVLENCACDHASVDACDQCQETGIANPNNH